MALWLDAFVPTFGLIALGLLLRRSVLPENAVWAGMERLVFYVLLPCQLAASISTVDLARLPLGGMAAALWLALLFATGASILLARALGLGFATMTSVLQGGIRFNTLMALAMAAPLFGPPGLAFGGITAGLIVPGVQVLLTLVFAMGGETGGARRLPPLRVVAWQMARNPLLLGCLAGFVLAAMGGMPIGFGALVRALGAAAVPLGLLSVGAALTLGGMRARLPTQLLTSALKLLVVPAGTWAFCRLLGLPPLATAVATLFMAIPTATTSYVTARAMGGDAPLMAALTTTEHVLAVLTLPLWVALLVG
ncbi:AEC family transporter [Roseomonas sp. NAR14]|uniref:AEC family transporter n=1 Tax=Roseomonas acroporae TaxID=2937791 RepID=A0A9X1Y8V2_9PROT|nr:AEC family transporter [Roseomonas acroporae]MCK8785200.1 AEC family transporter [Roseomonas acroporae]